MSPSLSLLWKKVLAKASNTSIPQRRDTQSLVFRFQECLPFTLPQALKG